MTLLGTYLLWILVQLSVEQVHMNGLPVIESVEINCDHDYVEYFKKVPNQDELYTFRVVKKAASFTINIELRSVKSQRVLYELKRVDGCQFLENQFYKKMFVESYNTLVVNNSFFKCPIAPKVYYLKNLTNALISPTFHPTGHYQAFVQIKMAESPSPFIMEILWKYKVRAA
ncbi:PREDICTED: uncharacterized protein LOC108612427 [Drosophila arizonae]|uniref:Uncharacterized protein LOC108612427 n=1 Tax=Drosophila arizonae TaxID=7263 RepID=A0ABM1P0R2_DROAR|nr:PREDICTED: uncharacterized protein LOC108612427 [Drosophila arizonae]